MQMNFHLSLFIAKTARNSWLKGFWRSLLFSIFSLGYWWRQNRRIEAGLCRTLGHLWSRSVTQVLPFNKWESELMVTSPSPFVRFRRRYFPAAKPRMIFDDFCGHRKDLIIFTFDSLSLAITSLPNPPILTTPLLNTHIYTIMSELTHEGKVALITGITGQDGSYLTEFLLSKGYTVRFYWYMYNLWHYMLVVWRRAWTASTWQKEVWPVSLSSRWGSFFFRFSCSEHRCCVDMFFGIFMTHQAWKWLLLDVWASTTRSILEYTLWHIMNEIFQGNLRIFHFDCGASNYLGWYAYTIYAKLDKIYTRRLCTDWNLPQPCNCSSSHIVYWHLVFAYLTISLSGPRYHPPFFFIQHWPYRSHLPWPPWNWCQAFPSLWWSLWCYQPYYNYC